MDKIIEKISSYNIFNNLLPGVVFCLLADIFLVVPLVQSSVINGLFLYYFVGLVISRFGSVFIEPLLKKIGVVNFSSYLDYVSASKKDPKIELLSEVNNMYRTFLAMIILLLLTASYKFILNTWPQMAAGCTFVVTVALLALFLLAYKKQTKYIHERVLANRSL